MQQEHTQQEESVLEINIPRLLQNLFRALLRFWLPVLLITVLCTGLSLLIQNKRYVPSYKAYCSFAVKVINKSTLSETNSLYAVYYDQDLAKQLDITFSYLLTSDLLTDDIRNYLGTDRINGTIQANAIKGSNIFVISTFSSSPEDAGKLLDAVLAVYADAARFVIGDMETELIEAPVVSTTPYNTPSWVKTMLLGAVLGLILSFGMLFLYVLFKRTVLTPEDLVQHLNAPCLGIIPAILTKRNLNRSVPDEANILEQGVFRESIRGIARKLEFSIKNRNIRILLVTSTAPGEGKSTLSQHLAETFAYWGKSVILLDGDMRKPSLYRRFGIKDQRLSLEDVLGGKASLETLLFPQKELPLTLVGNTEAAESPTTYIDAPAMKELLQTLSGQADLVIIDTPPCEQIIDAALYQQYADGIVYVIQQDRLPIAEIVRAVETLCESENKLLGYALNGAQQITHGYGKYGYGKYSYGKYGSYYDRYGYGKYNQYIADTPAESPPSDR